MTKQMLIWKAKAKCMVLDQINLLKHEDEQEPMQELIDLTPTEEEQPEEEQPEEEQPEEEQPEEEEEHDEIERK